METYERRMKCLEAAITASKGSGVVKTSQQIVDIAKDFEDYVNHSLDDISESLPKETSPEETPVISLDKPSKSRRRRNR